MLRMSNPPNYVEMSYARITTLLIILVLAAFAFWLAMRFMFVEVITTPVNELFENASATLNRLAFAYIYSVPLRENIPYALPDVEVFHVRTPFDVYRDEWDDPEVDPEPMFTGPGWYYAFGFPGCLWDSAPFGPFDSEAEAIAEVRDEDPLEVEVNVRYSAEFRVRM